MLLCVAPPFSRRLYSLYGSTLEKALSIVDVDGGNVTLVRGELSGRFLFQVAGSDVRPYTCTLHHCSCPAYTNTVVLSNDSVYVSDSLIHPAVSSHSVVPACTSADPLLCCVDCVCVQCKHQLAARLCHALGRLRDRVVSEAEFNRLMTEDRYREAPATHERAGHEAVYRTWTSKA